MPDKTLAAPRIRRHKNTGQTAQGERASVGNLANSQKLHRLTIRFVCHSIRS